MTNQNIAETEPAPSGDFGIELPKAPDAEAALLACIIEHPERFAPKALESGIDGSFFGIAGNASLFGILMDRIRAQKPVDPSSIREDIRRKKPEGLGLSLLLETLNCEKSPDGWDGYLASIRDTHARRLLVEATQTALTQSSQDALDCVRRASEAASAAISGQSAIMDGKRAVKAFLASFVERHENGAQPGLPTGIDAIDRHTGGMRKGELWVIGAKTSGGKSVLMLQMASQAILEGKKVAIFTLELGTDEVIGRLISCIGRISIGMIMNPRNLNQKTYERIQEHATTVQNSGIMVCDMADQTINEITGHCIRMQETNGLDLVLIDYLQMVTAPRIKGQNREQEVAAISRACKQLAKRLKCPVVTATQLNDMGQARESRAIEHDADNVIVIEHDRDATDGSCALHFWKCRNGKRGEAYKAKFNGELQRFTVLQGDC